MSTSEPLMTVAGMTAAVAAILSLLTAFGINLTQTQTTAILGIVGVIGPVVVGVISRRYVYSAASVQTGLDDPSIKTVKQLDKELAKQN